MTAQAQILPFRRPIAQAQRGRFMIVSDIETLDDRLESLPDDVVAFAFRRMVREFRLGRSLDDSEAAYKLHKHARTIARLRRQHAEFLALMDGSSGHARAKFLQRKSAKSSNFWRRKPQQNRQSAEPEDRTSVLVEPPQEEVLRTEGDASLGALAAGGRAPLYAVAQTESQEQRTRPAAPSPAQQPESAPAAPSLTLLPADWRPDDPEIDSDPHVAAIWAKARDYALSNRLGLPDWAAWWHDKKRWGL
jgi:hypothetical protein